MVGRWGITWYSIEGKSNGSAVVGALGPGQFHRNEQVHFEMHFQESSLLAALVKLQLHFARDQNHGSLVLQPI